jgi:hypothetical protein
MLKEVNLECSVLMMSSMYDVSMVSFGLLFIKKRLGGCSLTEKLASRMTRGSLATVAARSFVNIMKRVFGGRGSEVVARNVREELGRLIHKRPMCKYMKILQVMPLCGHLRGMRHNVLVLQAEARWRIARDQSSSHDLSSVAAEQRVRVDTFDVANARICTAAEDRHVDVVELCCIAEPKTVLAKDRLLFLRCLYRYFPCLQPTQLVAIMFTGSVHV